MIPANKFLIIMGNSGSGKNFLAKKLIEEYPQYFEETIQVTTRAKRNDYDPYIFVTKDQYKKLEHQLIGRTKITTTDGEENWYGTIFPADSNKYKIIILNKAGLEDFKAIVEKFNEVWEAQLICACIVGLINQDIDKIQQMDGRGTRDNKFIQDEIDGIKALCPEYLDVTNEYAKLEDI
jgi:guanylate kinase